VQASPHRAAWGAGHTPPQGIWRSVQAQVPVTQSQRRETQSLDHEQLAPAGVQAVPAMLKGQAPASTAIEEPASATGAGEGLALPPPAPPGPPPAPPTDGALAPPVPAGATSPLP
jgi:hypothetical protein